MRSTLSQVIQIFSLALIVGSLLFNSISTVNAAYFFTEDFSDNSAGWVLYSEWQIAPALASSGHATGNPDPAVDHTPTSDNGVAGVVIGGNPWTAIHPYYHLESPSVDISAAGSNATLEFYRWLNSDYTPYMQNIVQVFDGTNWETIWETGPSPGIQDSTWTQQSFNVFPYANSDFQVRFGFQIGSSGVFSVSSWNLDDVAVHNNPPAVPAPSALLLMGTGLVGIMIWKRWGVKPA